MTAESNDIEATASPSNILADKVARALQVRTDTIAMKSALDALAELDDGTTIDAKTVRSAMEKDALQQAIQLEKELDGILSVVSNLRKGCVEVAETAANLVEICNTSVISKASPISVFASSKAIADEEGPATNPQEDEKKLAATLSEAFAMRDAARQRLEAVDTFLDKFDLSDTDSTLLDNYNFEDINDLNMAMETDIQQGTAFLTALERVRNIRASLQDSFGAEQGLGANSALRIMEGLAQKQERAYERLYQWLQLQNQEDFPFSHPFVQRALATLRYVPAFYSHTVELVAGSRRAAVTRQFLLALTTGVDDARPIELKAHDPVAYVGDMLSFAFRSFSVEADLAKSLLSSEEHSEDISDSKEVEDTDVTTEASPGSILSISMSGLARPLKSRILQVITALSRRPDETNEMDYDDEDLLDDDDENEEGAMAQNNAAHLFEICGLLQFYRGAVEKGLEKISAQGQNNALLECLNECFMEAESGFEASVRVYAAMLDSLSISTGDTETSLVTSLLGKLSIVRETSPGFSQHDDPSSVRRTLSPEWAMETLFKATDCKSLDDTLALKLCVESAVTAGLSADSAASLFGDIEAKKGALVIAMVEKESAQVLDLCGLGSLAETWSKWKGTTGIQMASYPGLSREELQVAMKEFYESLYSPPVPSLETAVNDPSMRRQVRQEICRFVCSLYRDIYEGVTSEGSYGSLDFFGHTPDQVDSLFTV